MIPAAHIEATHRSALPTGPWYGLLADIQPCNAPLSRQTWATWRQRPPPQAYRLSLRRRCSRRWSRSTRSFDGRLDGIKKHSKLFDVLQAERALVLDRVVVAIPHAGRSCGADRVAPHPGRVSGLVDVAPELVRVQRDHRPRGVRRPGGRAFVMQWSLPLAVSRVAFARDATRVEASYATRIHHHVPSAVKWNATIASGGRSDLRARRRRRRASPRRRICRDSDGLQSWLLASAGCCRLHMTVRAARIGMRLTGQEDTAVLGAGQRSFRDS